MGKYSYYDQNEDVIFVDASGLVSEIALIDEVFDEAIALAKALPHKVYWVVNWKEIKFDSASIEHYTKRLADLLEVTRGIVRYGATNTTARVVVRTASLMHNIPSNLHPSKEAALEAIREGKV